MSTNAFTPTGNTVVFTAANPAPPPVQVNTNGAGANQYRFINTGTITVFVGIANTSANAAANATSTFIGMPETTGAPQQRIRYFFRPGHSPWRNSSI